MSSERFCILLTKCLGKKKEKKFMTSSTTKVDILPGTLLLLLDIVKHSSSSSSNQLLFVLETLDQEDIEVTCARADFIDIGRDDYNLLINVPTCADRFSIFSNKEWMQEGVQLKVGDYVDVYDKASAKDLIGILRYRGLVHGLSGIHFGVELVYNKSQGHSDGTFRNERYFQCAPESALFVGLHRIRRHKGSPPPIVSDVGGAVATNVFSQYASANVYGLKNGDRVVWISDEGPESGVVRWIGLLPDSRADDDITVGVEFDHAVGSGTGKYRDQRLFTAKQNHASLVPIMGLMKEAEYRNESKLADTDNTLAAFTDAGFSGKSQAEVIEEQMRLMEEAHHQKFPPRQLADGSREPEIKQEKKNSFEVVEHAMVHAPPASSATTPTSYNKRCTESKGVNPLYEFARSKQEYLPEGLREVIAPHGSQGPNQSDARHKPLPKPDPELGIGSLVEVISLKPLYGLIKWIGNLPDQKEPKKLIAGLEMEEETTAGTDGTFRGHRLFNCPNRKGLFVPLYNCRKDKRFIDDRHMRNHSSDRSINFGSTETPDLPGTVSPPNSLEHISHICGKGRGIQGHHNSCYLDATLLAMFYFTTVFDSILHRPKNSTDIQEYEDVQQVLKEGIVNPLRRHYYVRADKVMKLRKLLDKVGKIPGMITEEKDPEEFLNLLLNEVTKAEPFLKICAEDSPDTQHTYFYQLIMEKDERLVLPTTQQLFELSFLQIGIKLKEIPSCLIIQMPRFGKEYKMYRRILPSLELDITDVLENAPRECIICGDLAAFECKECYQVHGAGLNTIAFCEGCKKTSHQHKLRVKHKCRKISVPPAFRDYYLTRKATEGGPVPIHREKMELFAVICIQTSHYVSFVKSGKGSTANWIFFDSMADRMGEQSGYNIPEVRECSEIPRWLSDECYSEIMKYPEDKTLPEHMRRLICDAYICMYQSPDVMMFK